jgi:hypothetical protein
MLLNIYRLLGNCTVIVPALQYAWYSVAVDGIVRVNRNNRGAQSGVMEVTEEMSIIRHNIASMGETSVHILDEVILIEGRLFVGGVIEAHLLEAKGVP